MRKIKVDIKTLFILGSSLLIITVACTASIIIAAVAPAEVDPTQCSKLPTKQTLACTDCLRYGGEWNRRLSVCTYPESSSPGAIPDEAYAPCAALSSIQGQLKCRECINDYGTWSMERGCIPSGEVTLPSEGLFDY